MRSSWLLLPNSEPFAAGEVVHSLAGATPGSLPGRLRGAGQGRYSRQAVSLIRACGMSAERVRGAGRGWGGHNKKLCLEGATCQKATARRLWFAAVWRTTTYTSHFASRFFFSFFFPLLFFFFSPLFFWQASLLEGC